MAEEILLLGAGKMGAGYLDAARRMGIRVRLVDGAAHASTHGPRVAVFEELERTLEADWFGGGLRALGGAVPDGVVAFSEFQVLAAGLLQERFDLPGPGLQAAVASRNKALQRHAFAAGGIPQPEFVLTEHLEDARAWAAEHDPVVVKAPSLTASLGVELVEGEAAFDEAVRRRGGEGPLLVEQAVKGEEYSWEGLVRHGKVLFGNVTAKETTGPPQFVETAHRAGHAFEPALGQRVDEIAAAVVHALRLGSGIVHLELVVAGDDCWVLEVAVRTPGDFLMEVVSATYGVDLYAAVLALALDRTPDLPAPAVPRRYAASWFPTTAGGTVEAVTGVDEVLALGGVTQCQVRFRPGDTVAPTTSSLTRVGSVVLSAGTPGDRDRLLERVVRTLRVDVRP